VAPGPVEQLVAEGRSVWLDIIESELLASQDLQREGAEKFTDSFDKLLRTLDAKAREETARP